MAEEIRAQRQRDPAAAVAEDPKLNALLTAAEDDPAQRGLAAGVSLELQRELGVPAGERRVLTQQGLADLIAQIEAAPPAQRAALLQQIRESYGTHYDRVLRELETARLEPTTLALAKRLNDPLAARRIGSVLDKSRTALSEGLDPAEAAAVAQAARAAVPGPLAPAAERLALDRYRHSGDQDDAVAQAQETLGIGGDDTRAGGAAGDDVAEAELAPLERFEVQGPDGTAITVTRTEDGDLVFDNPVTGAPGGVPKTLATMIDMASAGDPVMRDLALRIAVLTSLPDGLPDDGSGTRTAVQAAIRERLHALIEETLGPIGGPNGKVVLNLHAAIEQSLRATNLADRRRAIEREAFPAFHDAKVKARTDELAGFLTETLIAVTPVVSEVEAGYRAYRALNDYESAIAAGDREAAARSLLEFGTALTEAVPLGGRFAKAGRFAPALDRAKARIGERVAELLGAGTSSSRRAGGTRLLTEGGGQGVLRAGDQLDGASKSRVPGPRNTPDTQANRVNTGDATISLSDTPWVTPDIYRASLVRKRTPNSTAQNMWEIENTGPDNFELGSVENQDSLLSLIVIQALDGPICTD